MRKPFIVTLVTAIVSLSAAIHPAGSVEGTPMKPSDIVDMINRAYPGGSNVPDSAVDTVIDGIQGAAQKKQAIAAFVERLEDWLSTYQSMSPEKALETANVLLDEASQMPGTDWNEAIWDLTGEIMTELFTIKRVVEQNQQIATFREPCYRVLAAEGHHYDWTQFPLAFDGRDYTLGDFLCQFTRNGALQRASINIEPTAEINGITLHFAKRKWIETDTFYADEDVRAAGRVLYAVVAVTINHERQVIRSFDQNFDILVTMIQYHSAPVVE